jgi:hypothetical protein
MTQDTTRTTAYTADASISGLRDKEARFAIHLANRMGEILPSRLKIAFQHSNGMDFQMADRLTLREMLNAAYMTGSAYEQVGKGVVMKDPVQKTEQFLNIGLISPSFK